MDSSSVPVLYSKVLDLSIIYNNEKIQPDGPVKVEMTLLDKDEDVLSEVVHFGEETEVLEAATDGKSVSFETEEFSPFAFVGQQTISQRVITANGESFTIEVTYGPEAEIPAGAKLEAREILEGTEEYSNYMAQTRSTFAAAPSTEKAELDKTPEVSETPEILKLSTVVNFETKRNEKVSAIKQDIDKENLEGEIKDSISFARFFDITIISDSKEIEPKAPVQVSIKYDDPVRLNDNEQIKAIHFAEAGTEVIGVDTNNDNSNVTDITFVQDSFSVTGTIVQKLAEGWPADGEYVLILKPEGSDKYYAVGSSGGLLEVKYNAEKDEVTFENLLDVGQVSAFKWTLSSPHLNNNYKELKNGSTYIDPFYNSNNAIGSSANARLYTNSNGNIRDYYRDNYLIVDEDNMRIDSVSSGSGNTSSRAVAFFASNFKLDDSQGHEPGGDPVLGLPDTSKVLKPNGDGTYELSLSVTGKAEQLPVKTYADVIIVLDRSGSMRYNEDGTRELSNKTKHRRDYIAQQAIDALAEELLSYNATQSDRVRLGFITFGNTASTSVHINDTAASDPDAFKRIVDQANGQSDTGTNWDAGLTEALNFQTRTNLNSKVYVVFVSDGNPTYYLNSNGQRRGTGYEEEPNVSTCYGEAKVVAEDIVEDGMEFYSVGVFGDPDRMEKLVRYAYTGSDNGQLKPGHYQTANDPTSLKTAFDSIKQAITQDFEYANVSFVDDITDYTATVMVDGTADNIVVTVKDADGNVVHTEDSYVTPVFSDGTATLKFTDGYSLKKGYTYTASFTVWPTQKAYDRIAALNNGAIYTTEDAENGITYSNGQYTLNTNSNAQVNYSTVTRETGKDPVITPQEPIKNIPCLDENGKPASIPLGTTGMYFQKLWYVGLQEEQFTKMQSWTYEKGQEPLLHVGYKDSSSATPDEQLDKTFEVMPIHDNVLEVEDGVYQTLKEKWAIAPGIMVTTLPEGAEAKATWSYNGTTYYALETGHDYTITEDYISGNFEPVNETYHPMFFGDKLMNVKLDGNNIVSMEEMDPELLTVKNWLRGGINVTKTVKDPEGNVVTTDDSEFEVTITVNAPTTDAANYPTWYKDTDTATKQPIKVVWYDTYANADDLAHGRIMYGVNGKPAEGESTGEDNYRNNLNYMEFVNGVATKTLTLKAGQTIRVTNLLRNSTYSVTEVVPVGYDVAYSDASGTIASNEEHNVSVINTQNTTEITVLKSDAKTKSPIVDANAEFELYLGTTRLYINKTDGKTITKDTYDSLDDAKKADYIDRVKIIDGGVGTNLVLTPGTYKLVEKEAPKGYVITTSEVYFKVTDKVELCNADGTVIEDSKDASVSETKLTIYNTAGKLLPNTGGHGTLPYTLGGFILMISALMYGFVMRRRERRLM